MAFMLAIAILVTAAPGASYNPAMGMYCSAPRDIGGGQTVRECVPVTRTDLTHGRVNPGWR